MYRKRWLAERVRRALTFFPVVAVVGARQTEKSTLVQQEFKVPVLFEALKLLVDREREPGRFLLTGRKNRHL